MEYTNVCPHCGKTHTLRVSITNDTAKEEVVCKPSKVTIYKTETREQNWHEIAEGIKSGNTDLKVGDEISCELTDGTPITVQVAHLYPNGTRCAMMVLKDCLPEKHYMNKEWTNEGGYTESDMRRYLNEEILPKLPTDLQEEIVNREIEQCMGEERYRTVCKLWLPSITEIEGNNWAESDSQGDVHFDLFKDEKSRVKQIDGETTYWWTRSPFAGSSNNFVYVYTNGSSSSSFASISNGVAFGFIIG